MNHSEGELLVIFLAVLQSVMEGPKAVDALAAAPLNFAIELPVAFLGQLLFRWPGYLPLICL
jgi:hypothetical protein